MPKVDLRDILEPTEVAIVLKKTGDAQIDFTLSASVNAEPEVEPLFLIALGMVQQSQSKLNELLRNGSKMMEVVNEVENTDVSSDARPNS